MSSKNMIKIFCLYLFVCLSVLMSGCGLRFGETAPKNTKLEVGKATQFSCIGQIGKTISRYVDADLPDSEINQFIDCLQYSVKNFEMYTSGKAKDSYAPEEVRRLLEDHFLKEKKISDALLAAVMDLKVAVVGGRKDEISREELKRAIDILEDLRPIVLRLRPYLSVLNVGVGEKRWESLKEVYPLEKVKAELSWAADSLANIFDGSAGRYSMDSLEVLLYEFRIFVDWEQHFSNTRPPESWIELLKVLKGIAVQPPEGVIEPDDWRPLLEVSSNWYIQFLRFRYQVQKLPLLHGEGLREVNALFEDIFKLIDLAIQRHPSKTIDIEEIDRLFDALGRLNLLPFNLRASSLQSLVRPLITRVFGDPQIHPDDRELRGLTRYSLDQARAEFSRWSDIQIFLGGQFTPGLSTHDVKSIRGQEAFPPSLRSFSEDIWRITKSMRPLFKEGGSNIFLVEENLLPSYEVTHSFHNLSVMNLIRGAVALGIRGFATNFNRLWGMDSGFTEDETQKLYEAIQPVGFDLKIMDPRSNAAGRRSFLEGNIFTYQGDRMNDANSKDPKSHLMVFEESMELVAFLYSGGGLSDKLYQALKDPKVFGEEALCETGPLGLHDLPMLDRACVRNNIIDLFIQYAEAMPELQKYLSNLTSEKKLNLADVLLKAAYNPIHSNPDYFDKSELSVVVMIVHYSESVMTRYNVNGDDIIDTDEIWKAYPTFRGFIRKMLKSRCIVADENRVKDVYRHIISNAALPEENVWTLVNFMWSGLWWNASMDRGRVQEVFASVISSVINGNATPMNAQRSCN